MLGIRAIRPSGFPLAPATAIDVACFRSLIHFERFERLCASGMLSDLDWDSSSSVLYRSHGYFMGVANVFQQLRLLLGVRNTLQEFAVVSQSAL